jgi:hypothetical protein
LSDEASTICLTVGLRRQWVAIGHRHGGLCRQMEHRRDLVFTQRSLEDLHVADVPAHDANLLDEARAHELGLRYPVAHQTDDLGSLLDQAAHEP